MTKLATPRAEAPSAGPGGPPERELEAFDAEKVRRQFPILGTRVRGKPLVYLDSAATAQKPRAVIDAELGYYERDNANVHRGVHLLSERATQAYEGARERVRRFIGAAEAREVIFVRGTTEGLNLVASTFGRQRVGEGDEILLTEMEHHSNIVPWQMLARERRARLVVAPVDDRGALPLDELERRIGPRTRLLAVTHVSNALGTVNPIARICEMAHARGVPVVVDGAQGLPHLPVDVRALGCDFYAFSGHKAYGPTGIGVLWGRREHLEEMPPWQGGGDMIISVTFEKTIYNEPPHKFEAGTPNIAGAVGLGAAIDWLAGLDMPGAMRHERDLLAYGTEMLSRIPGLRLVGTAPEKAGVLSFLLGDVHPHDVGTVLDREGIAIRTGHHCAQPLMQRYGLAATARASLGIYNLRSDLDALAAGLEKVRRMFA
jgi:cysteine desulfurase/selenocysteine lyase